MHGFNLALLGKHCWHFLQNPQSLVARIFKARYYPNSSLFEAARGGGVSFIWSGLWQAKEKLKQGFRWVVGDGEKIKFFEDTWLRGGEEHKLESTCIDRASVVRVCDLFVPGSKLWDVQKVSSLFSNCDAERILATPIPKNQVSDRIAWTNTVDGKYSVKSGYRYWCMQNNVGSTDGHEQGWKNLWKLEVPNKVKILLWRICRNNVPVRNLLRGKGVPTTILCPMCEVDVEHLMHVFLDCSFANQCWRILKLNYDMSRVESASEWLLERLACESREVGVQIATGLWGIWSVRNLKVWEQKQVTPELAVQWSTKQMTQWREVRRNSLGKGRVNLQQANSEGTKWHAPDAGRQKVNVDASIISGTNSFAIGMILRNHKGEFIKAQTLRRVGNVSVFEAEAWGVLEAIRWIQGMVISNVDIETDSMLTVTAIKRGSENYLEVGNVLQECRSILSSCPDFSISHVKKQANKVAHLLAREPCVVNCSNVFSSPPLSVLETMMYDSALS